MGAESGATSDTLQTIVTSDTFNGAMLRLRARHATEEIVVVHATSTAATATGPNIFLSGKADIVLDDVGKVIELQRDDNITGGWVEIRDVTGWELIGSATASSDSTVEFTWTGKTYREVMLVINAALPATDDVEAWIRTSDDGGSTFGGTNAYSYALQTMVHSNTEAVVQFADNADDEIVLTENGATEAVGNGADEGIGGNIQILLPGEATPIVVNYTGIYVASTGSSKTYTGAARRISTGGIDGIQFLFESGNIASGEFACYGLK